MLPAMIFMVIDTDWRFRARLWAAIGGALVFDVYWQRACVSLIGTGGDGRALMAFQIARRMLSAARCVIVKDGFRKTVRRR